jgi:flagellum-specific ATP synthase
VRRARRILSTYADMEELIRLGAYRAGASAEVDEAVGLMPSIEAFLGQSKEEATSIGEGYQRLAAIVGGA